MEIGRNEKKKKKWRGGRETIRRGEEAERVAFSQYIFK